MRHFKQLLVMGSFFTLALVASSAEAAGPTVGSVRESPSKVRIRALDSSGGSAVRHRVRTVHSAPELDPAGASAVALLLAGAGVMLVDRRRRASPVRA